MSFKSITSIIEKCKEDNLNFFQVVLQEDCEDRHVTKEESMALMTSMYEAMFTANAEYDEKLRSASGLVGGDGARLSDAAKNNTMLAGPFLGEIMAKAVKMGESNACMKRIVAAPTAGACGVVPAIFLTLEEFKGFSREQMIEAMYVVAGIGQVITYRAFISGAEGGCQAEIGSASAMAAGGIAYLQGGDATCIGHAVAMAFKNLMGLACDPVAGLVEVPCVKRNVIGAMNAVSAADMATSGVVSAIPVDEVIDAVREVGINMPSAVRETAEGGLAATPTGCKIKNCLSHY